ncbi:MAG: threonine synthase [Phycisphaerales bacterium]|nr:MAG: threonine synthase [Phycisphaerales bacterium]
MSLVTKLVCVNCSGEFAEGQAFTCPGCGMDEGILDVWFDLDRAARTLTRESLAKRPRAHWRYRELLPLDDTDHPVVTGVGWTPMIEVPRLAEALEIGRLRLKDEGRSGSGSFKDRASSIGVARAMQERATSVACASTGNAASSLAYCTAVAGLRAEIFVPHNVPEGKLAQLLAYGARVFRVGGSYAQAYDLCTRACDRFGWYNRNCAVNPYLVEGKKTGGLEVAEQCADDPPDWVVCSVGDGCSIAGVYKGLAQMEAIGIVAWRTRMLGVQAEGAAPIAAAWRTGEFVRSADGDTYADSINVPVPRNWNKALRAVRDSDGAYVTVTDAEIMAAVRLTGRLAGVFAEPAAAAAVAGIAAARRQGIVDNRSDVVAMITGNGLKDTTGALRAVPGPHDVPPDLDRVVHIVEHDAPCPPEDAG